MASDKVFIIKVSFQGAIKKIPLRNEDITYDDFIIMMQRVFNMNLSPHDPLTIKYMDDDGDWITIADTDDLSFALSTNDMLRINLETPTVTKLDEKTILTIANELRKLQNAINAVVAKMTMASISNTNGSTVSNSPPTMINDSANEELRSVHVQQPDPISRSRFPPPVKPLNQETYPAPLPTMQQRPPMDRTAPPVHMSQGPPRQPSYEAPRQYQPGPSGPPQPIRQQFRQDSMQPQISSFENTSIRPDHASNYGRDSMSDVVSLSKPPPPQSYGPPLPGSQTGPPRGSNQPIRPQYGYPPPQQGQPPNQNQYSQQMGSYPQQQYQYPPQQPTNVYAPPQQ